MKYAIHSLAILLAGILILGTGKMVLADPTEAEADMLATEAALENVDPVRQLIEDQLKAFRHRDAAAAYSAASANLQEQYNDPRKFLRSMSYSYSPLYEHVSYRFLDTINVGEKRIQKIELIGADGKPVTLLFKLIKEESGTWLIDGYLVLESDAQPT